MKMRILLFSLLLAGVASPLRADISVSFNEIMYHPATNESVMEWVEVRNQMSVDVDLTGWSIAGGIQYSFPSNTFLRGGRLLVIAASPDTLMTATGATNVLGPFTGRLSNNGNLLQLLNNNGRVVDEVNYGVDGDWPVAADGAGMSLAKRERDSASGPARNWTWSEEIGGTPGQDNFPLSGMIPVDTKLFPIESAWKYETSGTDLGVGWRQAGFDDAAWASGQAWFYHGAITVGESRRIPTLFNSGVGTNGVVLNANARDPHYFTLVAAQGVANTNSMVIQHNAAWVTNDTESRWLGVAAGATSVAAGAYDYLTRFSLTGFVPETAQVNLSLAAADRCTNVFLNGVATDISLVGAAAFSSFTLSNGFVEGTNTLEFRTLNDGATASPAGFRAVLSGTAQVILTNTVLAVGPTTHYFRKAFTFVGDPEKTALRLNTIVDDGAVFYLNGVEVFRVNMPAGPVNYSTPALASVAKPGYTGLVPIASSSLVPGMNVLSVEVHQAAGGGEDALFGAELVATPFQPPPVPLAFNELSELAKNEFAVELINYGTNTLVLDGVVIYRDGATNSEYAFPSGQSLAPNGYLSLKHSALGFLPVAGDRLYLFGPGKKHVYDGTVVKATARGRWPNGTGRWLRPSAPTPGAPNAFDFHTDIVINEIMYHHQVLPALDGLPPQGSPEQWIELFNRGPNLVQLTGWELAGGISYQFLPGQTIAPGGYLVVARDVAALRALYPGVEIVGDFRGQLSSGGDSIVLRDPIGNPANEVHYFDSGRWPRYPDGGGSSLELRDPWADNSKAETWAASDETGKSSWQTYSYRMFANVTGGQPSNWNDFVFGLLDSGECLIDDISVVESPTTTPVQFLSNGNFANGLAGWRLVGDHNHSRLDVDPDNPGNQVLHIVANGPQEHMNNHLERTYNAGRTVVNGRLYEISFRAKWLAGNNLLNTRLYFNRVASSTSLPMPTRSGTPGARNSRYEPNLGPTFGSLQLEPVTPQPQQPVTVSIVAQDPQGVGACEIWWSAAGGAWNSAPMTHQGGGLYGGVIPGYASGTIVQFYARATDSLGAVATYPAAGPNSGALYKVADGQANLAIAHNVRIILSPANTALLHAFTNVMSNENLPCTVVYDENRAYYDMSVRLKGSQRGRYSDTRVSFHLNFNPDDLFKGVHPVMLVDRSGAGDAADNKQQEILIRHIMLRAGGIPMIHTDICRVLAPIATHTGSALFAPRYEDEFIGSAYPSGANGSIWELELIYYPTTANPAGYKNPQPDDVVGTDISELGDSKEAYRYNFIIKNHRDVDDYSPFMAMAKTWSLSGAALDGRSRSVMDVNEWLRAWAGVTLCGVGDTYTYGNNHNLVMYLRPSDRKMMAFPWDMDFSFNRGTGDALVGDQNFSKIISLPGNLRLFYAHILDIIGSSFNANYMTYWVNRYDDFCPGQNFSPVTSYITARATFARNTINSASGGGIAPFVITGTNLITTSNNLVTLNGTAPVHIKTIEINGVVYPIVWTTVAKWTISVPVSAATNVLTLAGYDLYDRPVTNVGPSVTVVYTGPPAIPQGAVVFNEIMYHPATPNASYVELFNSSPDQSFDISGWRVNGLNYTFPRGSVITNGQFLVLAKDPVAYLLAYTNAPAPFAQFSGSLQPEGETLSLLQPGPSPGDEIVVDRVRYESGSPWPATANGQGAALQLLDPSRDNSRVGNWSDGDGWRWVRYTGLGGTTPTNLLLYLTAKGDVYIDSVSLVSGSVAGVGNNLLSNGGFEDGLASWRASGNHSNSVVVTGIAYEGTNSLHVVSTNAGSLTSAIGQTVAGLASDGVYTLSFWLLPSTNGNRLTARLSATYTNAVDYRPLPFTPGAANPFAGAAPFFPPLWLNEIQAENVSGLRDGSGQPEPWIELHNAGLVPISLAGYGLADNYSNLTQWAFPPGAMIQPGEFKIIFADGQPGQTSGAEWHTNFRLAPGTGSVALVWTPSGVPRVLDYQNYVGVRAGRSYGDFPDDQPFFRQEFVRVTPGAPNDNRVPPLEVFINEWMASNTRTLINTNHGNLYDDWIELYNPAGTPADLEGYSLTDNLSNPHQFTIPAGYMIPPHGFLLVWADGQSALNQPGDPDLHANFNLAKGGEQIGLFAPDGVRIDAVTFEPQFSDVSQGRYPDGIGPVYFLSIPTPRRPNTAWANRYPALTAIPDAYVSLGQTLSFSASATDPEAPPQSLLFSLDSGAPAGTMINPFSGLFSWTPTALQAPSTNRVTVRVTDNGAPSLSAARTFQVFVINGPRVSDITRLPAGKISLTFGTVMNKTYRVEYKDRLTDLSWSALGPDLTAHSSSLTIEDEIGARSQRFYRVVQLD